MEELKEQHQLGKIEVLKTLSEQQDALREIAVNPEGQAPPVRPNDVEKTEGEMFYLKYFALEVDFTDVKVPPRPETDKHITLISVEKRLNLEKILKQNKTDCIIKVNPSINLESITSPYFTNRAYMVWAFTENLPDLRVLNQRNTNGKRIMTVEERILLGIKAFQSVGPGLKYLDVEMPTLTSSYSEIKREQKAIVVRYQNGGMYVDVQNRHTPGGAREVFGIE